MKLSHNTAVVLTYISLAFLSGLANAQTISHRAFGKLTVVGSSYFSSMDGTFSLTYHNDHIPTNSAVFLRSGLEISAFEAGVLKPHSRWNVLEVKAMTAGTDESVWVVERTTQLYARGSSSHITALDYVFEIHLPTGEVFYDKGSDSNMGYYRAAIPSINDPCRPTQVECALQIETINQ